MLPPPVPELDVDEAAVRDCAAALLAASAQVDDLGTFVAGRARLRDWRGSAATAYRGSTRSLGRTADAMSLALRAVARRVDEHADELARLRGRRDGLLAVRAGLIHRMDPDHAAYEQDLAAWQAAVRAEDAAMTTAFERVLTRAAVEDHYGGVPDPADDALATRPPAGASPPHVNDWWRGLTLVQQLAVVAAAPGAIGNLGGIPARDRHAANRVRLDRDLADPDLRHRDNAEAAADALDTADETRLYLYDPGAFDGEGRVAVAVGDLDTADNVGLLVPGLDTDARSAELYAERALTLHEAAEVLDPDETTATLAWIGYDAPGITEVVREDAAAAGGALLDDAVDGLRAERAHDPAHLTAIGYSYGSTTLGHGAHDHGLAVDDLVAVGSPGMGGDADHARDLGLDPGHVWAGADSRDPVADLGNHGWLHLETFGGLGLGDDPVEDDFGARRFTAESTVHGTDPFDAHRRYFDHDTESLHNLTRIVGGDHDEVLLAEHVHDPWYAGPQDPESDRRATAPDTDGAPPQIWTP